MLSRGPGRGFSTEEVCHPQGSPRAAGAPAARPPWSTGLCPALAPSGEAPPPLAPAPSLMEKSWPSPPAGAPVRTDPVTWSAASPSLFLPLSRHGLSSRPTSIPGRPRQPAWLLKGTLPLPGRSRTLGDASHAEPEEQEEATEGAHCGHPQKPRGPLHAARRGHVLGKRGLAAAVTSQLVAQEGSGVSARPVLPDPSLLSSGTS